jgi:serine/threonine-protein kinase
MTDLAGKTLGHCRLLRKIGSGGMGAVYLARHETLDKEVAVKVIAPQYAGDPQILQRMLREAKLAAKLEHPHVVQIHDAAIEDNTPYIVMQYVDGRSLQETLEQRKRLTPIEALGVTRRVALALAAAHKLGVIHRDIKPANILLTKDGSVKVVDFGLARSVGPQDSQLTTKDVIVGTPPFMSPEQARGETLDGRSDLYSLGATLYCMLTGEPPFAKGSAMLVAMQQADDRTKPRDPRETVKDLPEPVVALVQKALAKPMAQRFQTAEELIRAIDALEPKKSELKKKTRWPWLVGAAAVLLLLLAALRPSAAERLYREALSIPAIERAIFKHREVIEKHPRTEWAKKSEARIGELQARQKATALQAAADFWKNHSAQFAEARKQYERFLETYPDAPEARSAIATIHKAEIESRYAEIEKLLKSDNAAGLVAFVDPKVLEEKGAANIRKFLDGIHKFGRGLGLEIEEAKVQEIRLDEAMAAAEVDLRIVTRIRRTGETKSQVDKHGWVLRNSVWYVDPDRFKK